MTKTPTRTTAPTGQIAPFGLRMLPELKAKLEEAAKSFGRSMNAEIVHRLETSFQLEQPLREERKLELMRLINEALDERQEIDRQLTLADKLRQGAAQPKRRGKANQPPQK